ncbi:MAG: glycosyltransferase family 39 protein [Anaerolineae bacterium]
MTQSKWFGIPGGEYYNVRLWVGRLADPGVHMPLGPRAYSSDTARPALSSAAQQQSQSRIIGFGLLALLGLIVVGLAVRLYHPTDYPFALNFDEGHEALDALRILDGWRPVFLPDNNGREPLFMYFMAALMAVFGPTALAVRLTSILSGVLMIAAQYLLVHALPLPRPRVTALVSAALIAVGFWPLAQSHQALRSILLPVWVALLLWAWWRALAVDSGEGGGKRAMLWSVAAGLFMAAALYTYLSARLLPLAIIVSGVYVALRRKQAPPILYLVIALAVAGILFLPQGLHFLNNPESLSQRTSQVSLLSTQINQGDLPGALARSARSLALAANIRGSLEWSENLRGRPIFDPLMGIAFLAGVGFLIYDLLGRRGRLAQDAAVLLGATFLVALVPSWLSEDAPSYIRLTATWPVLFLLPAWALERGGAWLDTRARAHLGGAAIAAVVVISGLWSGYDYYVAYPARIADAGVYANGGFERGEQVADLTAEGATYVSPAVWNQALVRFLTVERPPVSYDPRAGLILPPAGDARYAWEAAEAPAAADFGKRWPGAARTDVRNSHGDLSLIVFRLSPGDASLPPPGSAPRTPAFGDAIALDGHALKQPRVAPGGKVTLTLAWRAVTPAEGNLHTFVHLVDAQGRTIGQFDGPPLGGSYPPSRWTPGERIIQTVEIPVARDAAPGPATMRIGWYDWQTGERLPLAGASDNALDLDGVEVAP